MADDMIGRTVADRYRIVEPLGHGGLSTALKAYDTRLNRFVVLKVLQPHLANDPEFERRFQREARVGMRLSHPNLVRAFDYGTADGITYIVVEYVSGRSLADSLAQGKPLDVDYAVEIVRQVGEALSYAHRQGIIHRDIKPSNILISHDGRVLLSDLGLAIAPMQPTLTGIGTILGTPHYMSPEQARGEPLDPRSDIYSLGAVLYELLTGKRPFSGSTFEVLSKTISEQPASPRSFNPAIPLAVEKVLSKALAKDPKQRYQSVDEFLTSLAEKDKAGPSRPTVMPAPQPVSAVPRRKVSTSIWVWISAGLVGVVLLVLMPMLLVSGKPGDVLLALLPVAVVIAIVLVTVLVVLSLRKARERRRPQMPEAMDRPWSAATPTFTPSASVETDIKTGETLPYSPPPVAHTRVVGREPSAMAWLLVLNGPQRGGQLRLADVIDVGRGPSCGIMLQDRAASRQHARIQLENGRFFIYDLGSSNGTLLNGMRVQKQELRNRDELQIGNTIMLFVQAVSAEDLTVEAKQRLREFDSVWVQLTQAVHHD